MILHCQQSRNSSTLSKFAVIPRWRALLIQSWERWFMRCKKKCLRNLRTTLVSVENASPFQCRWIVGRNAKESRARASLNAKKRNSIAGNEPHSSFQFHRLSIRTMTIMALKSDAQSPQLLLLLASSVNTQAR